MVMLLLVAVVGKGQASDEVITQLTTSPFTRPVVAYESLFVPTLFPFNFHWYAGETPPN